MGHFSGPESVKRTDILRQKHLKERGDYIVDTLHVATCRMSDCPDVEDAFERTLGGFELPERYTWVGSRYVNVDLMPDGLIQVFDSFRKDGLDSFSVVLPLAC